MRMPILSAQVVCVFTLGFAVTSSATAATRMAVAASKPKRPADYGYKIVGPNGAVEISFARLALPGNAKLKPVTLKHLKNLPRAIRVLHRRRVRIRGYMSPTFKRTGITAFMLTSSAKAMAFPGRQVVTEIFPVHLRKGVTTRYVQNTRMITIEGKFVVDPWIEDGEVLRVYRIKNAIVLPLKPAK